jgi:hypothetical protein
MIKLLKAFGLILLGISIPLFFIPLIIGTPLIEALRVVLIANGILLCFMGAIFFVIWGIDLLD